MIRLSLDEINLRAPYEVAFARQSGTFRFTTRQGRQYTVGFVEETMLSYSGIYQFFIRAENHTQNDDDLFATIVSILEVYFEAGALALTYICDIRDNRQAARSRLFNRWFVRYPFNHIYSFLNKRIIVEDTEYFIAALIRKDEPLHDSVVSEFSNLIKTLESEDKSDL